MASFNFKVRRGNTVPITLVITVENVPFDLTGCTLFFTAKEDISQADADAPLKAQTGAGITHTDALAGEAKILLGPPDTDNVPTDVALVCDVQLKTATGEIYTVANGKLTFLEDVTRRTS